MTIENYRRQIDLIDDQLLNLLNERARLAACVGVLKAADGNHAAIKAGSVKY